MTVDTFMGWAAHAKDKPLVLTEIPLKSWDEEDDVEIQITDCGLCGSDIKTIDSAWGPTDYPCVVGHEIAGIVTRVGRNVTKVKVGDSAGVGAKCYACGNCSSCTSNVSNVCTASFYGTYNSKYPDGQKTYGGFADKWRGNKHFVVKIPDNLTNENACSMLCAGITTYAPLKRWGVDARSVVGIIGLGGLGHMGIMFAKALNARVVVISHSESKREVAFEVGADDYVNNSDPKNLEKIHGSLTHILCTGIGRDFKWEHYFPLLKANGVFINLALPEFNMPEIPTFQFASSQIVIASSLIGSPDEVEEMLQVASRNNIKTWYKTYPMKEINKAIADFRDGKPRFRYVLKN